MAENPRTYQPSTVQANRARMQGNGVGQKELNAQRDPNPDAYATEPERLEPFGDGTTGPRAEPGQASSEIDARAVRQGADTGGEARRAPDGRGASNLDDRNAADIDDAGGDLGAATPPNVDVHDLGQEDNPQQDWGPEGDPQMLHSANHNRRPFKTEAERGQGAKTRRANKDIISRRT